LIPGESETAGRAPSQAPFTRSVRVARHTATGEALVNPFAPVAVWGFWALLAVGLRLDTQKARVSQTCSFSC